MSTVDYVITFLTLNSACYLMLHFMGIHTTFNTGMWGRNNTGVVGGEDIEQIIVVAKQKCMWCLYNCFSTQKAKETLECFWRRCFQNLQWETMEPLLILKYSEWLNWLVYLKPELINLTHPLPPTSPGSYFQKIGDIFKNPGSETEVKPQVLLHLRILLPLFIVWHYYRILQDNRFYANVP